MNRWKISTIFLIGALILLLSVNLTQTAAQDTDPPHGIEPTVDPQDLDLAVEDSEEVILAPENPTALVNSSFTYQGQLKQGGAPVNDGCDFTWDVFAASSAGTSLATDTDTNVLVKNGLFTVVINIPASVIDGNARFLEIRVRCPTGEGIYTLLTPRQELQAAPYALGLRLPFSHTISSVGSPIFAVTNNSSTTIFPSLLGSSVGGDGVSGLSTGASSADNGVYGETNSTDTDEAGVNGVSTSTAAGGYFTSSTGRGVYGKTDSAGNFGGYFINSTTTTSGGALYASGDAKQTLEGDGFVKAGLYVWQCGDSDSTISRSFNNVNTATFTIINSASAGRCTVDFGFDVSDRYVTALAFDNGARIVTYRTGTTDNRLDFFRYDQNGTGVNGGIMILIY